MSTVTERKERQREALRQVVKDTRRARAAQQARKANRVAPKAKSAVVGAHLAGRSRRPSKAARTTAVGLTLGTIGLDALQGLWTGGQFIKAVASKKATPAAVQRKMRRTGLAMAPVAVLGVFFPPLALGVLGVGYATSVHIRSNQKAREARMKKLRKQKGPVRTAWQARQKVVQVREHYRDGKRVRSHPRKNTHA